MGRLSADVSTSYERLRMVDWRVEWAVRQSDVSARVRCSMGFDCSRYGGDSLRQSVRFVPGGQECPQLRQHLRTHGQAFMLGLLRQADCNASL